MRRRLYRKRKVKEYTQLILYHFARQVGVHYNHCASPSVRLRIIQMTEKLVKSTKLGVQPIPGLAMCSLVWLRQVRCNLFVSVHLFKMPNRIKIVKTKH